MDWLSENWFWILVFVLFIWMHRGGHGCHGGHQHGAAGKHPGEKGGSDKDLPDSSHPH